MSTGGAFGLYRWDMGPGPSGPDPHFHKTISESFVLSGAVRWYDGAHWIDATIGDFLFVPEGGVHAFRNESGEPASMLILFTPGAPREDYDRLCRRPGFGCPPRPSASHKPSTHTHSQVPGQYGCAARDLNPQPAD